MTTVEGRLRDAWGSADPYAFGREVETLAASGFSQAEIESVLEALLLELRAAGASDEEEERVLSLWDCIVGWCPDKRRIHFRVPVGVAPASIRTTESGSTPAAR